MEHASADTSPTPRSCDAIPAARMKAQEQHQHHQQMNKTTTTSDEVKKEATFHARPSGRVATSITTDHDKWVEHLAVVDMLLPNCVSRTGEPKYELQIRSFFVSTKTGKKTWDEPPSGAEAIEYANEEVRRMAEAQKRDLECVTIPNCASSGGSIGTEPNGSKRKLGSRVMTKLKRMGRIHNNSFRRRRRGGRNVEKDDGIRHNEETNEQQRKVHVKEQSEMSQFLHGTPFARELYHSGSHINNNNIYPDTDLEFALAKSANDESNNNHSQRKMKEEEELAIAIALSLSVKE